MISIARGGWVSGDADRLQESNHAFGELWWQWVVGLVGCGVIQHEAFVCGSCEV